MKTDKVINDCLDNLNPKNVLDIGIGKARCSKRFLNLGAIVIGIDLINRGLSDQIRFYQIKYQGV